MPRIGRANFAKCVQDTDCDALKHFKHIIEERPMRLVKDGTAPEDASEKGEVAPDTAVIVAKLHLFSLVSITS